MANPDGTLPPHLRAQFLQDGYLLLPNFFNPLPLLQRAKQIVEQEFSPDGHPLTQFSTGDDTKEHVGDEYFLGSSDKVRFFLEEDAVKGGELVVEAGRAVNKVGHALHVLDPTFHGFTFGEKIQALARSLRVHADPRVLQSMIICKQPSIGGPVPEHNDSTFLYTDPPSALGFWFALEDCTRSNGCLSFQPGSHLHPPSHTPASQSPRPQLIPAADRTSLNLGPERGVKNRFVRAERVGEGTKFVDVEGGEGEEDVWDPARAKVEECQAGSLVLIHGSVLHKSERNRSDRSRFIYTFHMIEAEEHGAKYDERNWLQPTERMPFSRLYAPPLAPTAIVYE
ncbi:unnamed protein product [Tilletia controversa]|uniref:Phytanoyl-CoA dioxygenase domain-containing protein 1 n=1 Tax=Tilletia controversa TaxID=13291 RepID=A0A8X7MWC6_9BASI|nr:hypothetical protein CF328_g5646 [Tilletia controversa]KAE8252539.1 hypothetical protein A4X06_0g2113 [Tilletia controversa]CAD6943995.1 unnamed protein product [Tilletia controversa]CAD6950827.1 unnamed protein product [Tilletia controversa]CAD6979855.1 unnamed protein product [Tilletia controversa]